MTNNKSTDELRGFYSAYSAWINGGAQAGTIFRRTQGLCVGAYDYFSAIGVDVESPLEAMHEAFAAAGLKEKLPFNENPDHYREEQARNECHLNPARLAWVAAELQEYLNAAPVSDRQAIANKVHGKCCRIPGATFYNAAHFAIDEMEACRAAPQPMRAELENYRNAQPVAWLWIKPSTGEEDVSLIVPEDDEDAPDAVSCGWVHQPLYTGPQPLTDAERRELQEYRSAAPDVNYQHLSELYHAQEKRLFKLAQRIKGPAFDKYAYSPSQAIDVLEAAIFGASEDASHPLEASL